MTPQEQDVARATETAFEVLAQDLDQLSTKHGLDSVAMMGLINSWGNFPRYYADWIQESWENWTPVDGDV